MKKFLANLVLFTITSIILAMPLQAWANNGDECITTDEKQNYIVTILEEPFGDADTYNKGKTDDEKKIFKAENCCRKTSYNPSDTSKSVTSFKKGLCGSCQPIVTTYNVANDPNSGVKSRTGDSCNQVLAIYSKGGTTMIEGYISIIYKWAAGLVGLIAVTVIIISGIQIAVSGGDSAALDSGKNRIIKSLSGLAVLFLSGLILYTINPNFFTIT
jgi:hypothetical protein